jgi:hypothetical protein
LNAFIYKVHTKVMGLFNVKHTKSKLMEVIIIILVSISSIFSFHVNTVYAVPDNGSGYATAQALAKDNNNTSNTPSVIRLSPGTNTDSNALSPTTSESSNGSNANPNASIQDTGSIRTHHTHDGSSSGNHHKDNSNKSHDLAHNIISKIKQKLKVGDIPFP